ncbi:unnamed protein product [Mesocestoides corti]|uniref:RNase_PH domain-containing protein n=1 Tax=Mesocestoides corti TaxID=53468 RepID=A0A0R3U9W1_MESCO|nr:unnamed protein product [Mesocestoides corti]
MTSIGWLRKADWNTRAPRNSNRQDEITRPMIRGIGDLEAEAGPRGHSVDFRTGKCRVDCETAGNQQASIVDAIASVHLILQDGRDGAHIGLAISSCRLELRGALVFQSAFLNHPIDVISERTSSVVTALVFGDRHVAIVNSSIH